MKKSCHGGARQASNPWTAVLSMLALISKEKHTTCLAHHPADINTQGEPECCGSEE